MTKKVDQSTRIIEQQQATIEQLQAKLSGESFVSHEHYAALQLERDQLAARVASLHYELKKFAELASECDGWDQFPTAPLDNVFDVLNRCKPASLARHDAELLRTKGREYQLYRADGGALAGGGWLMREADRIEQEADK